MISKTTEAALDYIGNPVLREYATAYSKIYGDYLSQVKEFGLDVDEEAYEDEIKCLLSIVKRKGARVRNDGKSVFWKELSEGCHACRTGVRSATFFTSLLCNRRCYFCFNPNEEYYSHFLRYTRDCAKEVEEMHSSGRALSNIAMTGGEPLLHKEETIRFFQRAKELYPGAYTRIYTNGDFLDQDTVEELSRAGLKEMRFSIRLEDLEKGDEATFGKIALAKEKIPHVMVEMPVAPGSYRAMTDVLARLDALDIYGINILELCFPFNNLDAFIEKGFKIRSRPYRVLYDYSYGGGLPVSGSEIDCLKLIEFAIDEGFGIGVHYCSVENRNTGQIFELNQGTPIPKTAYFSPKDFFVKTCKVFGDDIPRVVHIFNRVGYKGYVVNQEYNYVQFNPALIKELRKIDVEVGISSNVIELRKGKVYLRELAIDIARPSTCDPEIDL